MGFVEKKQAADREKGLLKKAVCLLFALIFGMLVCIFAVSVAAGEAIKESRVDGGGVPITNKGAIVQQGTLEEAFQSTASAEAFVKIVEETDVLRTRPCVP